jgi:hypothetical protein
MTEKEWQESADPWLMLDFLRGKANDRKLRLVLCACCRKLPLLFQDEHLAQAIRVAERYADGLTSNKEMRAIRQPVFSLLQ